MVTIVLSFSDGRRVFLRLIYSSLQDEQTEGAILKCGVPTRESMASRFSLRAKCSSWQRQKATTPLRASVSPQNNRPDLLLNLSR